MSALLALVLALPLAPLGPGPSPAEDPADLARALAAPDPVRARRAADELRALGPRGVELVFEGFADAPAHERRARSRWLLGGGDSTSLQLAAGALGDPDPQVRATLARYVGRSAARATERELGLAALVSAGEVETDARAREALADALLSAGGRDAARAMAQLLDAWPEPDRTLLARRLSELRGAGEVVFELVHAAFERGSGRRPPGDSVLAALLSAYARELAHREGPETPRERAPLALGLRHPASEVRAAAREALGEAVLHLRMLDRPQRADALLAALAREGPDPRTGQYERARQALQEGLDPEVALRAARELARLCAAGQDRSERQWLHRAALLEGMARLAAGDAAGARRDFERAAGRLDALLAERVELAGEGGVEEGLELLHQRALVELALALQRLAEGRGPGDLEVLERLRSAHELELRAQLAAARAGSGEVPYLDVLFEAPLSPYRLIFARRPHAAWPVERCLDAQEKLGRAMASVAPLEMPGFAPIEGALPGRAAPHEDPARRGLLLAILSARAEQASRDHRATLRELVDRAQRGLAVTIEDEQRLARLEQLVRARRAAVERTDLVRGYDDVRGPSWAALRLAQELREEGRTRQARELARRMLAAIEERSLDQRSAGGLQLAAEIQVAIGGSWTSDGEPALAEEELRRAVERLESLERLYAGRDAPGLRDFARRSRAGALVSLAVNANVKLGDQERALGYFEEAYELRQDDFMRVLLACYRARSGRSAEAREILADVPHAPRYYYNLACTYALLGEGERALELLERELAENHFSDGSRERQKEWARGDPDLASLREDPRFRHLVDL